MVTQPVIEQATNLLQLSNQLSQRRLENATTFLHNPKRKRLNYPFAEENIITVLDYRHGSNLGEGYEENSESIVLRYGGEREGDGNLRRRRENLNQDANGELVWGDGEARRRLGNGRHHR